MDQAALLDMIVKLTAARDALDAGFENDARPWSTAASDFADAAYEHADKALDAAIDLAIGSGVTVQTIEAQIGPIAVRANWFGD